MTTLASGKAALFALLASCSLAACQSVDAPTLTVAQQVPAQTVDLPERDFAALQAIVQAGGVRDVARLEPQEAVGASCTIAPLARSSTTLSPKLAAALDAAAEFSLAQQGHALMVLHKGEVIHSSFSEGMDQSTPTDTFSMHKSVLALAIGVAIEDGLIGSVDDRVGDYIAEWQNDPRGDIPLRDVLTMSSGLKLFPFGDPDGKSVALGLSNNVNGVALSYPMVDAPGDEFRYNNVNSQIAGIVLQRALMAAGEGRYADYLERRIWCPIGNSEANLWLDREGGSPRFYAFLMTGAENWARIGELIRHDGMANGQAVIPADWIAEMGKPSAANPQYGLQVWRGTPWTAVRKYSPQSPQGVPHSAAYAADDVLFFDGFGGQRVYVIPSAELTIVRTGEVNMGYDDATIVNLVLGGME